MVKKLLNTGARIDALGKVDSERKGPFCQCIIPLTTIIMKGNFPLINKLISKGAVVNNPSGSVPRSMMPLIAVIRNRHYSGTALLIQKGANPYDSIALEGVIKNFKTLEIPLKALANWGIPDGKEDWGYNAVKEAMKTKDTRTAMKLLGIFLKYITPI